MSADSAIVVENLSKLYRIGAAERRSETLVGAVTSMLSAPVRNFRRLRDLDTRRAKADSDDLLWALRDVSFEVNRGDVVGVIGRNGAGKSTLLKVLSQITEPTSGRVRIRGRVSALLEVGTGFHPELTGRENVYLNGTILGMTRREIDRKFDEIVDFSGVEKFLDTPVKRYSSGMKVRLAFAVAAHLEPEILIVDEVLAVGDYEFQKKCLGKMEEVSRGGVNRTVLFVSHNMGMIRSLCSRCILVKQGRIEFDGTTEETIDRYDESAADAHGRSSVVFEPGSDEPLQFLSAQVLDERGDCTGMIDQFRPASVRLCYRITEPITGANIAAWLNHSGMTLFTSFDTDTDESLLERRLPGEYEATLPLPTETLKNGTYSLSLNTGFINRAGSASQFKEHCLVFEVREVEDLSLKSYSTKRSGLIANRVDWNTKCVMPEATP